MRRVPESWRRKSESASIIECRRKKETKKERKNEEENFIGFNGAV
jgi:hypothetical protein